MRVWITDTIECNNTCNNTNAYNYAFEGQEWRSNESTCLPQVGLGLIPDLVSHVGWVRCWPERFFSGSARLFCFSHKTHHRHSNKIICLFTFSVCRNATHIKASTGSIHSPEFPELNYPHNMNCVWKISTPQNTRIRLRVRSMSIQRCGRVGTVDACSCDFLQIRDGQFSSDRLLATLCGAQSPKDLYSSDRHLWVRFRSDSSVAGSGFVASFSSAKIVEGEW